MIGIFTTKELTIFELNKLLIDNISNENTMLYKFMGKYISQNGVHIYTDLNPTIYLAPEFLLKKVNSVHYKIRSIPSKDEINSFINRMNNFVKYVINYGIN